MQAKVAIRHYQITWTARRDASELAIDEGDIWGVSRRRRGPKTTRRNVDARAAAA